MKILKTLFILSLILIFISCDSDNDENNTPVVTAESIIGSWSLTTLEADVDFIGEFNGTPITSATTSVGENLDFVLTFTATEYTAIGSYDLVTNTSVNGFPLPEDIQMLNTDETGTYSIANDSLTLNGELLEFGDLDIDASDIMDQPIDIMFNENGDLVLTQIVDTSLTEEGTTSTVKSDALLIFKRN